MTTRFVAEVEGEGISDAFSRGVPAAHRIARRGAYEVLFTTPVRASGTGTRWYLAPGTLPIDSVAVLAADRDHDLATMDERLPPAIKPLVAHIIRQIEREVGAADRNPRA
ncbi:hypothetical protein C8J45_11352 [Sphingomonas sp. PP-CE-3G-477]|uniref:hypothetical protein n=1 Tax=Sphingomonas sp. PP-CE-3G-477 TaxID=2135660 RepID=UPI000D357BDE|nr:hypothetical protein [Sphingomonas sp. PP-CE-3G-477]PTQ60101.1 hypothetical protein C8J45_11352 [Sphingomonas sp. PP-CE-3G-477]